MENVYVVFRNNEVWWIKNLKEALAQGEPKTANPHDLLLVAVTGAPIHADALHVCLVHGHIVDLQVKEERVFDQCNLLFFENFVVEISKFNFSFQIIALLRRLSILGILKTQKN